MSIFIPVRRMTFLSTIMAGGMGTIDFHDEIKGVGIYTGFVCNKFNFKRPCQSGPFHSYQAEGRKDSLLDKELLTRFNDSHQNKPVNDSDSPKRCLAQLYERSTPNILLNQPLRGIKASLHCRPVWNVEPQTQRYNFNTYTPKQLVDHYWENRTSDVSRTSSNESLESRCQPLDGMLRAPKSSAMRISLNERQLGEHPLEYIHTHNGTVVAITKLLPIKGDSLVTVTSHRPYRRRSQTSSKQLQRIDLPTIHFYPHKSHHAYKAKDVSRFGVQNPSNRSSPKDNNRFGISTKDTGLFEDEVNRCSMSTPDHVTIWHENYNDVCLLTSFQSEVQMPNICNFSAINASNSNGEKDSQEHKEIIDWNNAKGICDYLDQEIAEKAERLLTDGQRRRQVTRPISFEFRSENIDNDNMFAFAKNEIQTLNFHQGIESDKEYEDTDDVCTQESISVEGSSREDISEIHNCGETGNVFDAVVEVGSERKLYTSPVLNSPGPQVKEFVEECAEQFGTGSGDFVYTYNNSSGTVGKGARQFPSPKETNNGKYSAQALGLNKGGYIGTAKLSSKQIQGNVEVMAANCFRNSNLDGHKKNLIKKAEVGTKTKKPSSVKQRSFPVKTNSKLTKTKAYGGTHGFGKNVFQDTNQSKNKTLTLPTRTKAVASKENLTTPVTREQLKYWSERLRNKNQTKKEQENLQHSIGSQKEPIHTEGYMWLPRTKSLPPLARVGCSMFEAIKLPEQNKPTRKMDTKDKRTCRVPKMSDHLLSLPSRLKSVAAENKAKAEKVLRWRGLKECRLSHEYSSLEKCPKQNVSGGLDAGTLEEGKGGLGQVSSKNTGQCAMFLCHGQQRAAEKDMLALGVKGNHLVSNENDTKISSINNSESVKQNPSTSLSTKTSSLNISDETLDVCTAQEAASFKMYGKRLTQMENHKEGMGLVQDTDETNSPINDTKSNVNFLKCQGNGQVQRTPFNCLVLSNKTSPQDIDIDFCSGTYFGRKTGFKENSPVVSMSLKSRKHTQNASAQGALSFTNPNGSVHVPKQRFHYRPHNDGCQFVTKHESSSCQSGEYTDLEKGTHRLKQLAPLSMTYSTQPWQHEPLNDIMESNPLSSCVQNVSQSWTSVTCQRQKPNDLSNIAASARSLSKSENVLSTALSQFPPRPPMGISLISTNRKATLFTSTQNIEENREKETQETLLPHTRTTNYVEKEFQKHNDQPKDLRDLLLREEKLGEGDSAEIEDHTRWVEGYMEASKWKDNEDIERKAAEPSTDCLNGMVKKQQQDESFQNVPAWPCGKYESTDLMSCDQKSVSRVSWSFKSLNPSIKARVLHKNSNTRLSFDEKSSNRADKSVLTLEQFNQGPTLPADPQCWSFYNSSRHNGRGDAGPNADKTKPSTVFWKQFKKRHSINRDFLSNQRIIPGLSSFDVLVTGSAFVDRSGYVNTSNVLAMVPRRAILNFTGGEYQDMVRPKDPLNPSLTLDMKINHRNCFQKKHPLAERTMTMRSTKVAMAADQLLLQGNSISSFPSNQKEPAILMNLDFQPISRQMNVNTKTPQIVGFPTKVNSHTLQPVSQQTNENTGNRFVICKSCMEASSRCDNDKVL